MSGILYIVGTPIGNLADMSPRAIDTLKKVTLIAAEDTRHTKKLLTHFDIHTPMESYHKFSEKAKIPRLIEYLQTGWDIALVSNAGMPGISDPGELLVKEAIKNAIQVIPIPGPTALILALAASGLSTERFCFEGFLPKKNRIKRLYSLREEPRTMIFYEAGNRLNDTISDMQKILGDRQCVIARELTKKFEEIKRGNFSNISPHQSSKSHSIIEHSKTFSRNWCGDISYSTKGEFAIVVEGARPQITQINLKDEIKRLKDELGISAKEAIKLTAAKFDRPKREVYSEWHKP